MSKSNMVQCGHLDDVKECPDCRAFRASTCKEVVGVIVDLRAEVARLRALLEEATDMLDGAVGYQAPVIRFRAELRREKR